MDPTQIAVANLVGQQAVPSASGAPGIEGTPGVPAAPASPAPAAAQPADPYIQPGSSVSAADLYAQQQAAARAGQQPPAQTPPVPGQPPSQTPPVPGQPPPPPAAAPPAPAAPAQTVRDYARSLGYQGTERFADDASFLQHLTQQNQQLSQLAPHAQRYLQHAQAFEQWQSQQAAQQPAAPANQPPKLWNPPEWRPEWNALLTRDSTGNVSVVPGADPSILSKYQAYSTYQRTWATKFLENPEQMIGSMVEGRAKDLASQVVQEQLAKANQEREAHEYLSRNSGWLFQSDAQGRQLRNQATGQPLLSPAGQRFYQHLQAAQQMGMPTPAQANYAEAMLRSELAQQHMAAQQQPAAPAAPAQAPGWNVQQPAAVQQQPGVLDATRQPNHGGSFYGFQPGAGQGQPQNQSASLKDQLALALQQAGITDQHIRAEM